MFTIFGGAIAFTQWQKDQMITNPNMTAGDPVYFAASNGESYPTRAYITGGDIVADVPNELLTMAKPFTVRLDHHDEPVTIFRVEAADKPSGYVYEDNMSKPHVPGDVTIPAGATLRINEGANFLNYGESVESGAIFTANVIVDGVKEQPSSSAFIQEFSVASIDKSYDEILAAVQSGKLVRLKAEAGSEKLYLLLSGQEHDLMVFTCVWGGLVMGCDVQRTDGFNTHNENTSCMIGIYAPAGM